MISKPNKDTTPIKIIITMQSIICLSSGEVHFKNILHASVLADTFQSEPPQSLVVAPIYSRKSIHTLENPQWKCRMQARGTCEDKLNVKQPLWLDNSCVANNDFNYIEQYNCDHDCCISWNHHSEDKLRITLEKDGIGVRRVRALPSKMYVSCLPSSGNWI